MGDYETRPGYHKVFRTYFTDENGVRHYAKRHGHKAWCFWVKDDEEEPYEDESSVE